jgi:flagellin
MPSFINTNISSLNAQRNLNTSQSALQTSLQRLSSGLRINGSKDDAAGLAISNRMTSQINGNTQAARNANDGISLAQTAEGDLNQIGTNLQRMRDLAIQSANGTNSVSDRAALNSELQSLASEIDRVAQNSSFNGVKLLDGTFTAQNFQVGAGGTVNDQIAINSISSSRTSALGSAGTTSTATKVGTAITAALAAGDLTLNGQQVGASSTGIGGGLSTASATQVAVAINAVSATSGVTASANSNSVTGAAATAFTSIAANTFSINGIDIGVVAAGGTAAGQGANVAAAINQASSQTGVTAAANALTGALTLTAADGRDINVGLNATATTPANAAAAKATFLTQTGLLTGNVGTQASAAVAGTVITAGAVVTPPLAGGTLAAGVLTANGASVGAVTYGTGAFTAATAASAGALAVLTVGTLTAGSTYDFTATGGRTGSFSIVATGTAATDAAAIETGYEALAGTTVLTLAGAALTASVATFGLSLDSVRTAAQVTAGVTSAQASIAATSAIATANAAGFTQTVAGTFGTQSSNGAAYSGQQFANALNTALAAATGGAAVNGTVTNNATTGAITYVAGTTDSLQFATTGATDAATALTIQTATATQTGLTTAQLGIQAGSVVNAANHGTVTLTSTGTNGIVVGGALSTNAGLTTGQTVATVVSSVSSVSAIDISTAAGAIASLSVLDGALVTINSSRASLGAYQNRFASVVSSLQTTTENLTASRSRIVDTDFAAETASLSRNQILQQAGTAMLAQANQIPNGVLALLR